MLRFSLFGFPVSVHWMFWVTSALIGGGANVKTSRDLMFLLAFMVAAFLSVLIHELGHAFMMRRFKAQGVNIMLYAFGGLASGTRLFNRFESIVVSLAGPIVQIAVGLLMWLLFKYSKNDPLFVRAFLADFVYVSIAWAILNLIPIYPLDGGKVLDAAMGSSRSRITYGVGVVLAAGVACVLLARGSIFGTILFASLAYENLKRYRGLHPDSLLSPHR